MVVPFTSWQVGSVPAETEIAVGVPTVGVTVTVRIVCADGPLQPFATTWMFTAPENPLAHVIRPVVAPIVPAAGLLNDQVKLVLLVAVVA